MALPPHVPVAIKMLPHLIECAKARRGTDYEAIGQAIGMETRLFSRPLAFIRDFICVRHNLPPLTVIVKRKGGENASSSFDPAQYAALNSVQYAALQKKMAKKVYDYDKWDMALDGLQKMYGPC